MPDFRYTARTAEGKLVEDTISARDRAAAILQIEQARFVPVRIQPLHAPAAANGAAAKAAAAPAADPGEVQTLSLNHQFLFTEQLAHLLSAGMTLDEALGILVRRMKHPKVQALSQSLHRALVDGRSLSQAMRAFPRIFSPLYVNMVAAGEASGSLSDILHRLVTHLSDVKTLRDRVSQALVYPAVLVFVGILLLIAFMVKMVPQLMGFFVGTGQRLPAPTRILIELNHLIVGYWWVAVLAGAGAWFGFRAFTRLPEGRHAWDAFRLRIPVFGGVMRYRFYTQFARTLGTLMQNGVTLLKSLELLEDIAGNEYIRRRMAEVRRAVMDGASLSAALRPQKLFPEMLLDMMSVGEQAGRFAETMQMIANVYDRDLDKRVKLISALVPPVVIIIVGAMIGLMVYGILSAVFEMSGSLRGRIR